MVRVSKNRICHTPERSRVEERLRFAELRCQAQGIRLTRSRRRVLEILLEARTALGSYDILACLAAEGLGSQPPSAYRALDFPVHHGLAHRIERFNAYVACNQPDRPHTPAFLVCRHCRSVTETLSFPEKGLPGRMATSLDFTIERISIEAEGTCSSCRTGVPA